MRHCVPLAILACLPWSIAAAPVPLTASITSQDDKKAEFEKKLAEAEGNVQKLWKVYDWCDAHGLEKDGRTVLRKILKVDDSDKKAHELLGEIEFEGKWFPNQKKVDEYKQKKLEDEAKKSGKVVYNGEIVDPADVEKLKKGLRKLEDGRWVDAEEHKRLTEGWVRQDAEWVSPADAPNIDKGLWKCGDKWLPIAEADAFHASIESCWRIPNEHFFLYTTCKREVAISAQQECDRALAQFARVVGKAPTAVVPVLVLKNADEYNNFASSNGVELRGFSSIHGATMAEIWNIPLQAGMTSGGMCFLDPTNDKAIFGPMYVRHAAAQSLMEALDPSPKTLAALVAQKPGLTPEDWWKEKQFPTWFRYGVCVYVERYIVDQFVRAGGNPNWLKEWSIQNITNKGGLDALDAIFSAELSLNDVPKSQKLLNQLGLVMAFVVDGKCAPVVKEHGALKDAMRSDKDIKAPLKALEAAIRKNEDALRKFAGI
ncbi:MAG: hypothetical protein IT454_04050 [Planctomycetes bacterium]|nr:hypothetical protein [Planctomycetota bacterium]